MIKESHEADTARLQQELLDWKDKMPGGSAIGTSYKDKRKAPKKVARIEEESEALENKYKRKIAGLDGKTNALEYHHRQWASSFHQLQIIRRLKGLDTRPEDFLERRGANPDGSISALERKRLMFYAHHPLFSDDVRTLPIDQDALQVAEPFNHFDFMDPMEYQPVKRKQWD